MIRQLDPTAWNGPVSPVWICTLPVEPVEFSERTGIGFAEETEDGLGTVLEALCEIDGHQVIFQAYPDGPGDLGCVQLSVNADDLGWARARDAVCRELGLEIRDLPLHQPGAFGPPWTLVRVDDDGNEIEMRDYLVRGRAEEARWIHERRGHGQACFVRRRART